MVSNNKKCERWGSNALTNKQNKSDDIFTKYVGRQNLLVLFEENY